MRTIIHTFALIVLWYATMIILGVQSALGGLWLFIPIPQLVIFFSLFRFGIGNSILIAVILGLAFDLTLPLPFGSALLAFPVAVLIVYMLFQTIFTQETGAAKTAAGTAGIFLTDMLTWLFMHILFFFTQEGETLMLTASLFGFLAIRTGVGLLLNISLSAVHHFAFSPLLSRFFMSSRDNAPRF